MLNISGIQEGVVLDHIQAGKSMDIYRYLRLGELDCTVAEKRTLHLPKVLKNVIHCKNPRCITSIEQELPHIFYLDDKDHEVYRCRYCDEKHS